MPHDVLVAFGANLGDVHATLMAAETRLRAFSFVWNLRRGTCVKTRPVGGMPGDADFLNTVFRMEVAQEITPDDFLSALQNTEAALGRERHSRWAARKIDLDLLLFGTCEVDDAPRLTVPHPLLPWRRFVLEPAVSVAADMLHPPTGLTLGQLAKNLQETDSDFAFTPFPEVTPSSRPAAILLREGENHEKCLRFARENGIPVLEFRHLLRFSDTQSPEIAEKEAGSLLAALTADIRRGIDN